MRQKWKALATKGEQSITHTSDQSWKMAYLKLKNMKWKTPARRDQYKLLSCSLGLLFGSIVILWSTINWCSSVGEKKKGGGEEANAHKGFLCNRGREIWTLLHMSNNLSGILHAILHSCFQEKELLITRTREGSYWYDQRACCIKEKLVLLIQLSKIKVEGR